MTTMFICWIGYNVETLYKVPSLDSPYQISIHLAKHFTKGDYESKTRMVHGGYLFCQIEKKWGIK